MALVKAQRRVREVGGMCRRMRTDVRSDGEVKRW